ncbi:MAG: hypothetical protein ABIQ86_05550 [Steroidobacteraceae bacterium]
MDLPGLLEASAHNDKVGVLRNGDELTLPKRRQEVTVIGEVQNATSYLFSPDLDRNDYIVPLDTERMPRLAFWQVVTQILYNVAVPVAAVNSF